MRLPSIFRTPPPAVSLEITPGRVAAVEVAGRGAGGLRVTAYASEALTPGTVVPSLVAVNVTDPAALAGAIRRVFGQLGSRPGRASLAVPDAAARVSFVRFPQVPARASDLESLIRFQARKTAPFSLEDSQVSHSRGQRADGQEFVVIQAKRDVIREYESACEAAGASVGMVRLSTLSVAGVVLGGKGAPEGDWLLVQVSDGGSSLAMYRGEDLVFFRHRGLDGDASLGELVHQTAMYYQDRLGGGRFARVVVAGASRPDGTGTAGATVEARLGMRIEPLDVLQAAAFAGRISSSADLGDVLAGPVGLAATERMAHRHGRFD